MLIADLCCGLGGWVIPGHRFVGFDIENVPYPGELVLQDVRMLDGRRFRNFDLIVASPPCTEFSDLRFLHPTKQPPDMSIVEACWRIREESGVPMILENVRGARAFLGPEKCHRGPYYFWGDIRPPVAWMKPKPKVGAVARARRPDGSMSPSRLRQSGARDRSKHGARKRAMIPKALSAALIAPFTFGDGRAGGDSRA